MNSLPLGVKGIKTSVESFSFIFISGNIGKYFFLGDERPAIVTATLSAASEDVRVTGAMSLFGTASLNLSGG